MTDKEKHIILSVAGGLVTIVIGYLVWRHEQSVSSSSSQATLQAEQDTATQLEADLQNATQNVGGQAAQSYVPQSGDSGIENIPQDTNLEQILKAFFGAGSGGSTTGDGSSTSSGTGSGTIPGTLSGVTPVDPGNRPSSVVGPSNTTPTEPTMPPSGKPISIPIVRPGGPVGPVGPVGPARWLNGGNPKSAINTNPTQISFTN